MKPAPSAASATPASELLSIGEVAAATGISAETLRMWERRYGRPEAVRLPSGHRRYGPEQVRWLRRVSEALAHGHRPHQVVRLGDDELDALLAAAIGLDREDETLARRLDLVRAFETAALVAELEAAWRPDQPVAYLDGEIAPLLRAVGRAWADGRLEIRHEHYLSELVTDLLRDLRGRYEQGEAEPRVLLTTLSGERHGLGLQMAALLCAARGARTRILGVDTPNEDIVLAVEEGAFRLVGLSVSLATAGVENDRVLAALRRALPGDVRIVVGGEGARGVRRGPRGVEYAETLAAWDEIVADCA